VTDKRDIRLASLGYGLVNLGSSWWRCHSLGGNPGSALGTS
jgi:hypothetical protein